LGDKRDGHAPLQLQLQTSSTADGHGSTFPVCCNLA